MTTGINREEWLSQMTDLMRPMFTNVGSPMPDHIRVSVGWPSKKALAASGRRIGECWATEASQDGLNQIFISPYLKEVVEVTAVLLHELVHAAVGLACGHRGAFAKTAKALGLEGKMTATVAGNELVKCLNELIGKLPEYPHAKLEGMTNGKKKDGTRMLKVKCPQCNYTVRTTQTWIDVGMPTCPCGTQMETEAKEV